MLDTTYLDLVTRKHFEPAMQNQIYNRFVLWNELNSGGQIKTLTGSGLEWNIVAVEHQALGLLSGYEAMANQQINPLKRATLTPAFYYATVGISKEEEVKNSGSIEKLIDIVTTQVENSRTSFQKRMQIDAFADGTSVDGKSPLIGLEAIMDNDNTYAGIDRSVAANAFWRANVDATAHAFANLQDSTHASYLPRIMRNAYTNATHDLAPNLGITTKAIYNLYQDIAGDKLRINNEMADLGFGGAEFNGGAVRLSFDDHCTADHMYFLTMSDFNLWIYAGMNFTSDGWKEPVDQAAKITHFYWMGQLQCTSPRQQSVIRSIATS